MAELEEALADLEAAVANATRSGPSAELDATLDLAWTLICSFLVLFMQAGFGALEAGAVRTKNMRNIVLKNLLDVCVGTMAYYIAGYGLSFGRASDAPYRLGGWLSFAGDDDFALRPSDGSTFSRHTHFVFELSFAATAATIVSGALAERVRLGAYAIFSFLMMLVVVPLPMHWAWAPDGFLHATYDGEAGSGGDETGLLFGCGMIDFSGATAVHLVGGCVALMGSWITGPRLDEQGVARFDPKCRDRDFMGWNVTISSFGILILWFGWYGFNCGSTLALSGGWDVVAARAATATTLAATASACSCFLACWFGAPHFDVNRSLNGILAGLVAITAGVAVVHPWAAVVIGLIAGVCYWASAELTVRLRIDDPLEAGPLHGACGAVGAILVGFLADGKYVEEVYGRGNGQGVLFGGDGRQLAAQIVGVLAIAAWSLAWGGAIFYLLRRIEFDGSNLLRVTRQTELEGLDIGNLQGFVYPSYLTPFVTLLRKIHRIQADILRDPGLSHLKQATPRTGEPLLGAETALDPHLVSAPQPRRDGSDGAVSNSFSAGPTAIVSRSERSWHAGECYLRSSNP